MSAEPRGGFPKRARIRKRREYLQIQATGRRVSLPHLVLLVAARAAGGYRGPRLGITASRKVGGAVVRNRIRRLVREAFRTVHAELPEDLDVIVIVKRAPPDFVLNDVVAEWRSATRQLEKRLAEARAVRRC